MSNSYEQVIGVKLTGELKGWTSPKGTTQFHFSFDSKSEFLVCLPREEFKIGLFS